MTQQVQVDAATGAPPAPAPSQPQAQVDELRELLREIPKEIAKVLSTPDLSVDQLKNWTALTFAKMFEQVTDELVALRDWIAFSHAQHADQLDEHEERLQSVEDLAAGTGSQLIQEHADLFSEVAVTAQEFARVALTTTTDPAGKAQLQVILDKVTKAQQIIDEITLNFDDDDDDVPAPAPSGTQFTQS